MPHQASLDNSSSSDELKNSYQASMRDFFNELLQSNNTYIAIQSILDGLDLWFGAIKYYFDILNPASSNLSTLMMNDWLLTEEGLLTFLAGNLGISILAFYGNYATDENRWDFADRNWPYLRDCFKGLRWTLKSTRNCLLVAQNLTAIDYVYLIAPVGVGLGLLSVVNRYFNRSMIESRKSLQDGNDLFRRQIKCIRAGFQIVDEKLLKSQTDRQRFFAGSIIQKNLKTETGDESKIYVWINAAGDEIEIQRDALKEKDIVFLALVEQQMEHSSDKAPRVNWDIYKQLYLKTYRNQDGSIEDGPFKQAFECKQNHLHELSRPDGALYRELHDLPAFQENPCMGYVTAIINGILNAPYYFLGALTMVVLSHEMFVLALIASSFFMVLNILAEAFQEFDYQRHLKITEMKAKLAMHKRMIMVHLDKANDEYAQLGSSLSLHHELNAWIEQDFAAEERKNWLSLIQLYLSNQDGHCELSDFKQMRQDLMGFNLDEHKREVLFCLLAIQEHKLAFEAYKIILKNQLILDDYMTFFQGIKNGLYLYGAFNGLLITISTVSFLFNWTFPPALLFASLSIGCALLLICTWYNWHYNRSTHHYEDEALPVLGQDEPRKVQFAEDSTKSKDDFYDTDSLRNIIIDPCDIKPSKNGTLPQEAEVTRQALSGFKKGVKCTQLMQVYINHWSHLDGDTPAWMKALYISMGLLYAPFFALKGYKGLRRVSNEEYKQSFLFFGAYHDDDKSAAIKPSISTWAMTEDDFSPAPPNN